MSKIIKLNKTSKVVSGWLAWKNVMPGPGKQTFHLFGTVTVNNSCVVPELKPEKSIGETLFYRVVPKSVGKICLEILMQKTVETSYSAKNITGTSVIVLFPDGSKLELPIQVIS